MLPYMTSLRRWLHRSLCPAQRRFLANLCVFPGSFSAAGAAAVNATPPVNAPAPSTAPAPTASGAAPLDPAGESNAAACGVPMPAAAVQRALRVLQSMSLVQRHASAPPHGDAAAQQPAAAPVARYSLHSLVQHAAKGGAELEGSASASGESPADQAPGPGTLHGLLARWMLQHPEGPGQQLLRSKPSGPTPDPAAWQSILRDELLNFGAAAGVLQRVLLAAGAPGGAALADAGKDVGHALGASTSQVREGRLLAIGVTANRMGSYRPAS
jgi:hypothetical protein